jgi:predicted Zn-dependent protease
MPADERKAERPGGSRVSSFHRPDTAILVKEALERNEDDVDALFVLAALKVQGGKVQEGLSILDRVLRLDPAYPGAWMFKAKLHGMQGDDDAARSARRRAEESDG